jgi:hypothetical protein
LLAEAGEGREIPYRAGDAADFADVKYRLKKQRQRQEQAKKIRAPGADFCVFRASTPRQ